MHILNTETGQLEEVADKEPLLVQLLRVWTTRPRKTKDYPNERQIEYMNWGLFLKCLAAAVITLIIGMCAYNGYADRQNALVSIERYKNGYCEVSTPGVGGSVWQKCK